MKRIIVLFCLCFFGFVRNSQADTIYAVVNVDTATIWHKEYHTSCSSSFMMDFRLADYHIDLFEVDTSGGSYCLCYFDVYAQIGSLQAGIYTVDVYEVYWPSYPNYNPQDTSLLGNTTFEIQGYPASIPALIGNNTSDCYQNVGYDELHPTGKSGLEILSVNPNPLAGIADIVLNIPKQGMLELKVLDETGRPVETIFNTMFDKGVQHYSWDAACLPAGLYLLQISGKQGIFTLKVVVTH